VFLFILSIIIFLLTCIQYVFSIYIILGILAFLGRPRSKAWLIFRLYIFLGSKIEPYLSFVRSFIPPIGRIDFSAGIVFLAAKILKSFLEGITQALA
jgi:uncharacterized protein YggT (Ycf19 family)